MLVAYILTKSRFLRVKLVRNKESGVFKKGGYEYTIDRKKIYTKKFLGLKLFFWAMYLEGNPYPMEFDEKGYKIVKSDVDSDKLSWMIYSEPIQLNENEELLTVAHRIGYRPSDVVKLNE